MTPAEKPAPQTRRPRRLELGATCLEAGGTVFRVWAPRVDSLAVRLVGQAGAGVFPLRAEAGGYFTAPVPGAGPGDDYLFCFPDGSERPDPVSRWQPQGVHGPSRIVDPAAFAWSDAGWHGLPLEDYLVYELHVGTFSAAGTFAAIIPRLDDLLELGVSAVELMPVAQFPGERNWGYDGVYPFAVQHGYGGPEGLKRLVDACHDRGLAVILDVVYNHLGPEGNYLGCYGPYFTDRYRTPWGEAINFDGPESDAVRDYFIANALFWVTEYHLDGLRLDAVHGIFDCGARPFLRELTAAVHAEAERLGRSVQVIAESDRNDVRTLLPAGQGGLGFDAQWNDDFHHALHALLTGERSGYYADFGELSQLAAALRAGFVYTGQYSRFRRRRHGSSAAGRPPRQFVVCAQNHDQVGNRARGDRLAGSLPLEKLKLAAGTVLLSPGLPLLFMGEEYGETAPFSYFTSHADPQLAAAVQKGRREEFAAFVWQGEVPDPQAEATFLAAKLDPQLRRGGTHRSLYGFYRELIRLRRELPALRHPDLEGLEIAVLADQQVLELRRRTGGQEALCLFNFAAESREVPLPRRPGGWRKLLDSAAGKWGGSGAASAESGAEGTLAPWSCVIFATR